MRRGVLVERVAGREQGGGRSGEKAVHAAAFVWALERATPDNIYILFFFFLYLPPGDVASFLCHPPRVACLPPIPLTNSNSPSILNLPTPSSHLRLTPLSSCPSFPVDPSPCSGSAGCGIFFSCSLADVTAFGTVSSRNSYIWS